MRLIFASALLAGVLCAPAWADPLDITPGANAAPQNVQTTIAAAPGDSGGPQRYAQASQSNLGGGLIEFLFGGAARTGQSYAPQQDTASQQAYATPQDYAASAQGNIAHEPVDPKYDRQTVAYDGHEKPGTIIIDTPNKFLFLVEENGKAIRYGIGVGRPGFTWAGVKRITAKREWPDWRPPNDMLQRRPDLPRYMAGGPENPLGARALYLGSTLYRIHGSNEPWTIGTNVSSGCIRMRNADVIDLYSRVDVGTTVVVL